MHPDEDRDEGAESYQGRWSSAVAVLSAMVDLMGWGGLQWLYASPHSRHLPESVLEKVLPRLRHWVERLVECLTPRGADLSMAPAVRARALGELPASARVSISELVTRVWLGRECKDLSAAPGKVLHGAMLLAQLGMAGSLSMWRAGGWSNQQSQHNVGLVLFPRLMSCLYHLESSRWEVCLGDGLTFVEGVLAHTRNFPDEPFSYSHAPAAYPSKAKPRALLDPAPLANLLELLVTVAAAAAKAAEDVILPEGLVRTWLAPRPHLVKAAAQAHGDLKAASACNLLYQCADAAAEFISQIWSEVWVTQDGNKQVVACGPPTVGERRVFWAHAEVVLRLAVVAAVGVVNSPRGADAMKILNSLSKRTANLSQLCFLARPQDGCLLGWRHPSTYSLLASFAKTSPKDLRLKLLDLCQATEEVPGAMLLSAKGMAAREQGVQHVLVDPHEGLLTLRSGQRLSQVGPSRPRALPPPPPRPIAPP